MNVAARFNDALTITAGLSMIAFLVADDRPELMLGAAGIALLGWACGAGKRALKPQTLPRLSVSLLVIAVILYTAMSVINHGRGEAVVSILGLFLSMITAIKMFDRRTPRDDAQLLALALFDIIAAVLTGGSLVLGILLAILTPLAISSAVLWQFRAGIASTASDHLSVTARDASTASGKRFSTHLVTLLVTSTTASCLAASVVFVLAPRNWAQDVLGRFGQARTTTIGFNETPALGQSGFLSEDPTPVLDAWITDPQGNPVGSANHTLYLRGSIKELYDRSSRTWHEYAGDRQTHSDGVWVTQDQRPTNAQPLQQHLRVRLRGVAKENAPLFTLWKPAEVRTLWRDRLRVFERSGVLRRGAGGRPRSVAPTVAYEYEVVAEPDTQGTPLTREPPRVFVGTNIESFTRQVLASANVSDHVSDNDNTDAWQRDAVVAIRDHLRSRCTYTTEMIAPAPGQDPIDMFLFDTKRGHCEYFASAMVAMCQSVRIPARMVLGYVATEYSASSMQYTVRESNAHAWVEAHVGGGRWQTFDPSPPGDFEALHRPAPTVLSWVRRWWESLEFAWAKSVVSFDRSSQSKLLGMDDGNTELTWAQRARNAARENGISGGLSTLRSAGVRGVLRVAVPIFALGAAVAIALRLLPGLRQHVRVLWAAIIKPRKPAGADAARKTPGYTKAIAALRAAGLDPSDSTPPAAHASTLASIDPALGVAFAQLAELYYRVRFGNQTLASDDLECARSHARTVVERAKALSRSRQRQRPRVAQ